MCTAKLVAIVALTGLLAGCNGSSDDVPGQSETVGPETHIANPAASPELELSEMEKAGKTAFLKCRSCHTVNEGEPHITGPNLHGFFGSEAGSREGYAYSEALLNSEVVWDETSLDAWLEKPSSLVPGTKMVYPGSPKKEERDALIAYLKVATK